MRGTEPAGAPPLLEAQSIQVGLKIVSLWKKDIDIRSIVIKEPKIGLIVNADGSTNVPEPKIARPPGKPGLEPLLDWRIGQFSIENGTMQIADRKSHLNAKGEKLHARLSYDFAGPRYKGEISIWPLEVNVGKIRPLNMNVAVFVSLEKNRVEISNAKFDLRRSHVEAAGAIENLSSPKGVFRFTARVAAAEAGEVLRIPAARQGTIDLAGSFNYNSPSDYTIAAAATIRGLEVLESGIHISGIRGTCQARLNPHGLELDKMALETLGGHFTGRASLPKLEDIVADGAVEGIALEQALAAFAPDLTEIERTIFSGRASGPVHVESKLTGVFGVATTSSTVAPAPGGIPVQGSVDLRYEGESKDLSFDNMHIDSPGVRVDGSGVLNKQMTVRMASGNLVALAPAINAFSKAPVKSLPIELKNGNATFDGTLTGNLKSPRAEGAVALTSFVYSGIQFDRFTGQVTVDQSSAEVRKGTVVRGAAQAQVSATVGLNDWKSEPASPISGTVTLAGADIAELLDLAGEKQIPVRGGLALSARLSGTAGSPRATADVTLTKGVAYDEPFDRVQASVDYSSQAIHVRQATIAAGPAQLTGSVLFEPTRPPEFRNGRVQFQVSSNDMALDRFETMKRRRPDLTGFLRANVEGSATIHDTQAQLTSLKGSAAARELHLDGRLLGAFQATAQTQASSLHLQLDSNFLNSKVTATGDWRLTAGYPGEATARFSPISLAAVRTWLNGPATPKGPNFDGAIEGSVVVSGPLLEPLAWKANASLSKLEVYPLELGEPKSAADRFTLRNEGPVLLTMAKSAISVARAHFTGPSSDVTVTGAASLEPRFSLDLRVNGGVNLAILQNAGAVTVNASVRGTPDQPSVNGRLDVKGGSLHFADITTGISNANGIILFSGDHATLQDFKGEVGGGNISLTGVVGFAGGQLTYRVDSSAKSVRVRYPEGVSTSANAELSLHGTSQRSTLSGLITVLRTGFAPRTDFSSILGKATEPVRTPSSRTGPLSGMQFDVRVQTAPDISFESSLAQDIQVEGNLRLQGTPYNPVLLGRLNVTQGEINFFGTKYAIDQGSVTFANPVKLEPVLNVDLTTRVQGIDVTLTISGPINKLNITPRSDPPMSYSDVLALLATGSAPSSDPTLAARQSGPQQSFTQAGASALIGQVVANPVSGRLQRFFGVSSLKINPRISGVENNPQARVTLEQQVTKDVTFTYITNISSTNQIIVRIEWALNKNWSAIAVRDENGLFGLDFLYKKRFK